MAHHRPIAQAARAQAVLHTPSADTARTDTVERVADPHADNLEAAWNAEWEKNLVETALERVKGRVKPELYQIFDLMVKKEWPALKVTRRLQVSLAQVYYARCKVALLVRQEVKKLERQGF